jgi:hypothetical protein
MRFFILVFGLVGLAMGAAAGWALWDTLSFRAGAMRAEGVVVDMYSVRSGTRQSVSSGPAVRFSAPGAERGEEVSYEFSSRIQSDPPAYHVGERVAVLYRPENPADARIDGFTEQWFLPLLFGLFGVVFGGVALGFMVAQIRKRRMWRWLEEHGMPVDADVLEVGKDYSLKVNGRSPWVLRAQWQHPLTQAVHVFESEHIWFDPTPFMGDRRKLTVRVDADDPKRHRVDIGFLPKKG